MDKNEFATWYDTNTPRFTLLLNPVRSLIEFILKDEDREFLSVTGRLKEKVSALEKFGREKYQQPDQDMTDLCGIRIITFLGRVDGIPDMRF